MSRKERTKTVATFIFFFFGGLSAQTFHLSLSLSLSLSLYLSLSLSFSLSLSLLLTLVCLSLSLSLSVSLSLSICLSYCLSVWVSVSVFVLPLCLSVSLFSPLHFLPDYQRSVIAFRDLFRVPGWMHTTHLLQKGRCCNVIVQVHIKFNFQDFFL